jgi:rhomboid protease GluP
MQSNPPPEKRPHPLEMRPEPLKDTPRPQVTLRIPSVKPYVTYAILAINVAVFVIRALSPDLDLNLYLWGADSPRAVLQHGDYYRLLTSMFLHMGIYNNLGGYTFANGLHLLFNSLLIYQVGTYLEPVFGHLRFGLIYLLGGLASSVLSDVVNGALGNMNVYSVGASGAAFALIGAEMVYLYQHRKLLRRQARARLPGLLTLSIINLLFGVAGSLGISELHVDNWGHIGGLLGGLILTWFIGPFYLLKRHPDNPDDWLGVDVNPLHRKYAALSLYLAGLLGVLILGVFIAR